MCYIILVKKTENFSEYIRMNKNFFFQNFFFVKIKFRRLKKHFSLYQYSVQCKMMGKKIFPIIYSN